MDGRGGDGPELDRDAINDVEVEAGVARRVSVEVDGVRSRNAEGRVGLKLAKNKEDFGRGLGGYLVRFLTSPSATASRSLTPVSSLWRSLGWSDLENPEGKVALL